MANVPNGVETLPKNFNRLSSAHERYRRQTTDGRMIANSEREREFAFAKKWCSFFDSQCRTTMSKRRSLVSQDCTAITIRCSHSCTCQKPSRDSTHIYLQSRHLATISDAEIESPGRPTLLKSVASFFRPIPWRLSRGGTPTNARLLLRQRRAEINARVVSTRRLS